MAGAPTTQFVRLGPDQTGGDMVNHMEVNHALSYLYHSGMTCGGVVVKDLNGDGRPELEKQRQRHLHRCHRGSRSPPAVVQHGL